LWVLVTWLTGCTSAVDVCAPFAGRACVALEVRGLAGTKLDQLRVLSTALPLDALTPPARKDPAVSTPIFVPVLVGDPPAADPFDLTVAGLFDGITFGSGTIMLSVAAKEHQRAEVALLAREGLDLAGVDLRPDTRDLATETPLDLAGRDFAGQDLAAPPGSDLSVPPDLMPTGPVPRLVAPLSTSTVSQFNPTLKWDNPLGPVDVQICRDRACTDIADQFTALPTASAKPTTVLTGPHWYWWRARYSSGGPFTAPWEFWSNKSSTSRDTFYGTRLDMNGDGLDDVAIADGGKVFVFIAKAGGGLPTSPVALTMPGGVSARSAAPAGDVNGDGFGDLIAGCDGNDQAFVFYGGADGVSASRFTKLQGDVSSGFGSAVAGANDTDGDGFGDVVVGACSLSGGCAHHARVFRGSATGIIANVVAVQIDSPPGSATGNTANMFGATLIGADLNGDGLGDVVVCAFFEMTGNCYTYHSKKTTGVDKTTIVTTLSGSTMTTFGQAIAPSGDVNGDGFEDVIIGGWEDNEVIVFTGSTSGLSQTSGHMAPMVVPATASSFGFGVAGGPDFDDDGQSDVLVVDNGSHKAYFYSGSMFGFQPGLTFSQPSGETSFGQGVMSVGDVTGDHIGDFVVTTLSSHKAYLYPGKTGSPVTTLTLQ
jgi:hypothetical protein